MAMLQRNLIKKTEASCRNRKKSKVCMEFFRSKIENGEDVDIDKAIKIFDAGKKKKNVKSKDALPTG